MTLIDDKLVELRERGLDLGGPTSEEASTPDGVGRYRHFARGSIYWSPSTGAHEVHGAIRDRWARLGWERGPVGYPMTDELTAPDAIGRYNHFGRPNASEADASIYWTPRTGAHEVYGAIRIGWAAAGWERSSLGYPTSGENDFENGRARFSEF